MMKRFILLSVLLMILLTGCLGGAAEQGDDDDRMLFITAPIVDKVTGLPVKADVYVFEAPVFRAPDASELKIRQSDHIRLALQYLTPDSEDGRNKNWIVVEAAGYQRWAIELSNNTSGGQRHYTNRVELIPIEQDLNGKSNEAIIDVSILVQKSSVPRL